MRNLLGNFIVVVYLYAESVQKMYFRHAFVRGIC